MSLKKVFDFLKKKTPLTARAQREFEQARRKERSGDYEGAAASYETVADLYEEAEATGSRILFRDRLKAGIACVRCGRHEAGLVWLDPVITSGKFPSEARLHAGYASAKLGDRQAAQSHWDAYPPDPLQSIISQVMTEQAAALRNGTSLDAACEAVAQAWNAQDQHDRRTENMKFKRNELIRRRGF
ncbi:hypothetical protein [Salidesulfovibrio brasiliensis]